MPTIFLSHSSVDKNFTRHLASALSEEGIEVWMDENEINVGDSLLDKLSEGLVKADYLAVILSPSFVSSEWAKRETKMALIDEISGGRIRVIPILYKDCEIPLFLREKVYADFRDSENDETKFNTQVMRLLSSLSRTETAKGLVSVNLPVTSTNLRQKEKETILVTVYLSRGDIYECEVPADAKVYYFEKFLVNELKLFKIFSDPSYANWFLYSVTQDKKLQDNLTFRQNGVKSLEEIEVGFEGRGG